MQMPPMSQQYMRAVPQPFVAPSPRTAAGFVPQTRLAVTTPVSHAATDGPAAAAAAATTATQPGSGATSAPRSSFASPGSAFDNPAAAAAATATGHGVFPSRDAFMSYLVSRFNDFGRARGLAADPYRAPPPLMVLQPPPQQQQQQQRFAYAVPAYALEPLMQMAAMPGLRRWLRILQMQRSRCAVLAVLVSLQPQQPQPQQPSQQQLPPAQHPQQQQQPLQAQSLQQQPGRVVYGPPAGGYVWMPNPHGLLSRVRCVSVGLYMSACTPICSVLRVRVTS